MLFNSIDFALFLPIVFIIYWFFTNKNLQLQNALLVVASYFFYGYWDWRFLALIIFSSFVDYFIGLGLGKNENKKTRKLLLTTSILINLGFLGFFKYFNFFADSFAAAFTILGKPIDPVSLNIILPVGISFYTFQTLSYSIDVYKEKLKPTTDLVSFFAFVSFFPQLVAGPIERATNLLPQFYKKRQFDYASAVDGMRQILWGLFKKMVIADNCAIIVNQIFNNSDDLNGSTLAVGAILFAFQIYGDFSGYSDIAIGTSRLFGFNLMQNFAFPYFSRDIAEFWRRWHISLSTWFRDYLYIPLGGSKGNTRKKVRNTFIIFIVSGFWHGANWTFVAWGFINACFFLPLLLTKNNRRNIGTVAEERIFPNFREFLQISLTFSLTVIAWIFFRSDSITSALNFIQGIFSDSLFKISISELKYNSSGGFTSTLLLLLVFILAEWLQRSKKHTLQIDDIHPYLRHIFYVLLVVLIIWFQGDQQEFIYFQF